MGMISSIELGGGHIVSHLEFADDFMTFTRGSGDDMLHTKLLLRAFKLMTGLQVKLDKTAVLHLLNDEAQASLMAGELGCQAKSFLIDYLKLPLRPGRLVREDWMRRRDVITNIRDAISSEWLLTWKGAVDQADVDRLLALLEHH
ncbi:hypothetical protein Cni_G02348 [Canna indica]|uniref:Reverse transcriptase domain-containing protein n=1 Tax=Canna indica TaxID=4628 RepID=A0AAQ3JPB0_9LILI|nr:hypothetical protein Cni_G02348 [Canna indica]